MHMATAASIPSHGNNGIWSRPSGNDSSDDASALRLLRPRFGSLC